MVASARSAAERRRCPFFGRFSGRVHRRYVRTIADLPCASRKVRLRLSARRFVCEATSCRRRIFAERFEDGVVSERSRRTSRLECLVHHLGLALGGRPTAGFAGRLMVPVSNDTLQRVIRRRAKLPEAPLSVIGIDDWAWRRNHRCGTRAAIGRNSGGARCLATMPCKGAGAHHAASLTVRPRASAACASAVMRRTISLAGRMASMLPALWPAVRQVCSMSPSKLRMGKMAL